MSDRLGFAEIAGPRVELLPPRIVLSLFNLAGNDTAGVDACQTMRTAATGGVIGWLGLGAPAQETVVCPPAAIVNNNGG